MTTRDTEITKDVSHLMPGGPAVPHVHFEILGYYDEQGELCHSYERQGTSSAVVLLGLLEWVKANLVASAIEDLG